jgi:nucleoside-diphosphate-sugar epimerase
VSGARRARRVLVTGGAGYFGALLVEALAARGDDVVIFDIIDAPERPAGASALRGDIRDPRAVRAALDGVELVFHAVAQVPLARDPRAFWTVNHEGTRVLLEESAAACVAKVVHISSSAIYGVPAMNPVDERSPAIPGEAYGRAKLAAEHLVRDFVARGLDATIVRPRTIVGPGRMGLMTVLFDWVRRGYNLPVFGRGDNIYQFVHSEDLVSACLLAGEHAGADAFNIGADEFGTMRESLEGLLRHARAPGRVRSVPAGPTARGMRLASRLGLSPLGAYHWLMYGESLWFDTSHAKERLGWAPRWSNVEALCAAYDWWLAHGREAGAGGAGGTRSHHRSPVKQGALALVGRML